MLAPTASTRLVGILGHPVSHSLSPRMQNAAFAARGLDWAYLPLPCEPARLGEAVRGLVALGFEGANVTIPHKTAVLDHCDEVDEIARKGASANTLLIRDGRVHATSTDGLAVTSVVNAAGARVLMLGAGGAARAVATALMDAGVASLRVYARRREASEELVSHLRRAFPHGDVGELEAPEDTGAITMLVNATPIREELPAQPQPHQQIVDLAYRADGEPTAFVAAAREVGSTVVVDGLEILVRQGAASFERWTGVPAPIDAMRSAVAP